MKRKGIFVAGVLSLILVDTSGKAVWASGTQETSKGAAQATSTLFGSGKGYVELFGKTFCAADAPAATACDWRMPAGDREQEPAAAGPRRIKILGKDICFGPAARNDHCWLEFPAMRDKSERRASL